MKIEMQKITDKQFIILVFIYTIFKIDFYRTKMERKFRKNYRKILRKYIEILENFERK